MVDVLKLWPSRIGTCNRLQVAVNSIHIQSSSYFVQENGIKYVTLNPFPGCYK